MLPLIDLIKDIKTSCEAFMANAKDVSSDERKTMLKELTEAFTKSLKHGESKVTMATQTYDMVDRYIRRLDEDLQRFEDELMMTGPKIANAGSRLSHLKTDSPAKRASRFSIIFDSYWLTVDLYTFLWFRETGRRLKEGGGVKAKEQKREKSGTGMPPGRRPKEPSANSAGTSNNMAAKKKVNPALLPPGPVVVGGDVALKMQPQPMAESGEMIVDPNEPTYCICNQVSFGAMIGCDNDECEVEWFHYGCVGLDSPPKGKWYCDDCKTKLGIAPQ